MQDLFFCARSVFENSTTASGFDVIERYLSFYRNVGFAREAKWESGRLESISTTE